MFRYVLLQTLNNCQNVFFFVFFKIFITSRAEILVVSPVCTEQLITVPLGSLPAHVKG